MLLNLSLMQKIGLFLFSLPIAVIFWAFVLIKIVDCAVAGWKNNDRKKKWIAALFVAFFLVIRSLSHLFC